MTPDQLDTINSVIELVNAGGTLAVLVILLVLFYQGKIVPKIVLDRILTMYEEQVEKVLTSVVKKLEEMSSGLSSSYVKIEASHSAMTESLSTLKKELDDHDARATAFIQEQQNHLEERVEALEIASKDSS